MLITAIILGALGAVCVALGVYLAAGGTIAVCGARFAANGAVGVIGGADGPTAIFVTTKYNWNIAVTLIIAGAISAAAAVLLLYRVKRKK